jgi:hypothetical protein
MRSRPRTRCAGTRAAQPACPVRGARSSSACSKGTARRCGACCSLAARRLHTTYAKTKNTPYAKLSACVCTRAPYTGRSVGACDQARRHRELR